MNGLAKALYGNSRILLCDGHLSFLKSDLECNCHSPPY